uniref:PDZ domain-containing protein n=2 Tax=Lutzomyia longipalpis TaxID=7200 RepID=A0A1B0CQ50_LUTLO
MEPRIVFLKPKLGGDSSSSGTYSRYRDMERSALVNNCTTLSTHLSPPPTFSRLPPDGHEFPPNFSDTEPTTHQTQSGKSPVKSFLEEAPPLPKSVPPPLVPPRPQARPELLLKMDVERPQNGGSLVEMRKKSIESSDAVQPPARSKSSDNGIRKSSLNSMWRKDERSEKSVKDKIAMFSNPDSGQIVGDLGSRKSFNRSTEDLLDKCDSANPRRLARGESLTKKARSVENLDVDDVPSVELRPKVTTVHQVEVLPNYSSLPRRNGSSLAGVGQLTRTISFSGYGSSTSIEDRRRNSITNMLETRKKSMSKLRGLVIPERVAPEPVLLDLPEIKSADLQKVAGSRFSMPDVSTAPARLQIERKIKMTLPTPPTIESRYKSIFEGTRRPLATTLSRPLVATNGHEDITTTKVMMPPPVTPPVKPPRTSLITPTTTKCPQTDESEDSDSVVSSRISTPVGSPVVAHNGAEKMPLTRTLSSETNTSIASSTTSTLTSGSGSQASCSSLGSTPTVDMKRRVVKSSSNESGINRKSILASAKSRSGPAQPDLVNYKLVDSHDVPSIVDRVINVATFVEVVSDSEEVSATKVDSGKIVVETEKAAGGASLDPIRRINHSSSDELSDGNEMNEVAKWVRKEAAKTTTIEEPLPVKNPVEVSRRKEEKVEEVVPMRTLPRSLSEQTKLSTAEIRRQFESKSTGNSFVPSPTRQAGAPPTTPKEKISNYHDRFSSWESVASNSSSGVSSMPARSIQSNGSETMQSTPTDFGSFSSLGSSHSLITAQDLQFIIEEADPPLQTHEAFVVVLQRDSPECSIGITLAGGADYEAKEITVHKILANSPADKDGRLKKGDRILAINGLSMRGLTHRESVTVLKTPRPEVVVVVTRSPSVTASTLTKTKRSSLGSLTSLTEKEAPEVSETKLKSFHKASRSLDLDIMMNEDVATSRESLKEENGLKSPPKKSTGILATKLSNGDADVNAPSSFVKLRNLPKGAREVEVVKDSCGLGFSIEGGYDSPLGNRPLLVKKVFMGGAAEKSGKVKNGSEIVGINGYAMATVSRVDAWSYMKRLPAGPVKIVLL